MEIKKIIHTTIWHTVNAMKIPFALKAVALNHIEELEKCAETSSVDSSGIGWNLDRTDLDKAFAWIRVGNGNGGWNDAFWWNLFLYQQHRISKKELIRTLRQI